MVPANQRLTRVECTTLLATPELRVVFNALGTLKYLSHPTDKGFCVVTGSKQQKKAVLRNKVRRQLYALFTEYYRDNTKPLIGMLYVSKKVYELSFQELKENINALFTKAQKNT